MTRPGRRLAGGALLGAAVALGWFLPPGGSGGDTDSSASQRPRLEAVPLVRERLVERQTVFGTIAHRPLGRIVNRLAGSRTVTAIVPEGSLVSSGETLYRLDDEPVVLMDGSVPAYRDLRPGLSGRDVRQLERALVELGHSRVSADGRFDRETRNAVRRWQRSETLPPTGVVELGRVVFLPAPLRVGAHLLAAQEPAPAGAAILEATRSESAVLVELDVSLQALVERGDLVGILLPDGSETRGRVLSVGQVAHARTGVGPEAAELVVDLEVGFDAGELQLDRAPVSVFIARRTTAPVLAAPVAALVPLESGGYGLEVVGDRGTELVPVSLGTFAGSLVEVSGDGLEAGVRVLAAL